MVYFVIYNSFIFKEIMIKFRKMKVVLIIKILAELRTID